MDNEDYLKRFDKIFGTNTTNTIKKLPMLHNIFNEFIDDLLSSNEEYLEYLKKVNIAQDKLIETFDENQEQLFENYCNLHNQASNLTDEQLFMFGFIMAEELRNETKI